MTTNPPTFFTPGQRNKFITRLTTALGGANAATVALTGPPRFLREAYPDGKLQPSGPIIVNHTTMSNLISRSCAAKLKAFKIQNGGIKMLFWTSSTTSVTRLVATPEFQPSSKAARNNPSWLRSA